MNVKALLNKALRNAYYSRNHKGYVKEHYDLCKKLFPGTEDKEAEGEQDWLNKWSGFPVKANPIYYRFFRQYDGNNPNIAPEDICRVNVEPCLNPQKFRKFYADKNSWDMIYGEGIFPKTIVRCIDGIYYTKNYERLVDFNDETLYKILAKAESDKFAVKPTRDSNSSHGFDTIKKIDGKYVYGGGGYEVTAENMLTHIGKNFIVQPFLKQHEELSKFCHTSVNPIRIITYKSVKDDKIHVLKGGVLRVGFEGEENDGTHGNGKFIGINDDGTLKHKALDYLGNVVTEFNGIDYTQNYSLPNFDKVKQAAIDVASKVIHHRLLAFDIMVDDKGNPVVFEFNIDDFSVWLAQFTGESAFGEYTDEILKFCKKECLKAELTWIY